VHRSLPAAQHHRPVRPPLAVGIADAGDADIREARVHQVLAMIRAFDPALHRTRHGGIAAGEVLADRAELVVRTKALDRVLLHNYYVIPQWEILEHRLVYWDKFEQPAIAPAFDRTFDTGFMTWWINPEKAKRLDSHNK